MKDHIVEEVHLIRRKLSARFDFDVRRICEHVMERQRESGREYVPAPKKHSVSHTESEAAEQSAAADGEDAAAER